MWFDSHCHLFDVHEEVTDGERAAARVVERARAAGVANMVVLGTDEATSRTALALTDLPGVWAAAAVHPGSVTEAKGWSEEWIEPIDALLQDDKVVAVGETGLDRYWDTTYFDAQCRAFEAHIDLAKKHRKPLVIHTRDSAPHALDVLAHEDPPDRVVFHCWSGDEGDLKRALDLGAYISFAGNVSFRGADDLRARAREVPGDRLLIETDAPYLAPVPHRGSKNEPAYVVAVGAAVAEARGESLEDIERITDANAKRFFGISS